MINVSPCKKSDYDVLSQIEKSIFQDPISKIELKNFEEQPAYKIWKIEEKKIVGFVSFFHVKDEIEIIKICIKKSHQRKNYGSMIGILNTVGAVFGTLSPLLVGLTKDITGEYIYAYYILSVGMVLAIPLVLSLKKNINS